MGKIYTLGATSEWPVEWAILARKARSEPGAGAPGDPRCLAVLVDTATYAGRGDLLVAEPSLGALTLRTRYGLWLDPRAFSDARETGSGLPSGLLAEARERYDALREGRLEASPIEARVEERLEYREWIEEVAEPAFAAVESTANDVAAKETARSGQIVFGDFSPAAAQRDTPSRSAPPHRALAASLLLGVIGLATLASWQQVEIQRLRGRSTVPAGAEQLEPGALSSGEPEINVDLQWLLPSVTERGETAVVFSRESRTSVWILQLQDPEPHDSYRVRILDGDGNAVWRADGLRRNDTLEVTLAIPRAWLPSGDYAFELYAVDDETEALLDRYPVTIRPLAE